MAFNTTDEQLDVWGVDKALRRYQLALSKLGLTDEK